MRVLYVAKRMSVYLGSEFSGSGGWPSQAGSGPIVATLSVPGRGLDDPPGTVPSPPENPIQHRSRSVAAGPAVTFCLHGAGAPSRRCQAARARD